MAADWSTSGREWSRVREGGRRVLVARLAAADWGSGSRKRRGWWTSADAGWAAGGECGRSAGLVAEPFTRCGGDQGEEAGSRKQEARSRKQESERASEMAKTTTISPRRRWRPWPLRVQGDRASLPPTGLGATDLGVVDVH
jgi:hypothetical protein